VRRALLAAAALAACGKDARRAPADAGTARYEISVESGEGVLPEDVIVEIDGVAVDAEERHDPRGAGVAPVWRRTVEVRADAPVPTARATFNGPCGRAELPLTWTERGHARAARFVRPAGQDVTVYVDNRDAAATTVAIGVRRFPVAAGAPTSVRVFVPDACSALDVRVADETVGALPPRTSAPVDVLVDPVGTHCYAWRVVAYNSLGIANGNGRVVTPISWARFHVLPAHLAYYLTDAPPAIAPTAGAAELERSVLAAVPCPR